MDETTYRRLSEGVAQAFVAALPGHLGGAVADPVLDRLIDEIEGRLTEWSALPAQGQRRTPLEIVRTAFGAEVPAELVPVTSRDLGEQAWRAHVAWGMARAEVIAGLVPASNSADSAPAQGVLVATVSTNVMDRTRIAETVESLGARNVVWRNPGAVAEGLDSSSPAVAFVDLEHAAAHDVIRTLVAAGVRTVAYGPHVDDHALAAARALGASEVMPRSRFFRSIESLVPRPA